jgi:hypothetical protein
MKSTSLGKYTEDILTEYKEILKRLYVCPAMIGAFINLIRERGEAVEVRAEAEISPDPRDDPFCACSEAGSADMIFTLNPKDFRQSRLNAKVLAPTIEKMARIEGWSVRTLRERIDSMLYERTGLSK